MKVLDLLRKLGIVRFGTVKGTYTSYTEMPDELMFTNVYDKEKDLTSKEDLKKFRKWINPPRAGIFVLFLTITFSLTNAVGSKIYAAGVPGLSATSCTADASAKGIDPAKYFGAILTQVRKDWNAKAKIYYIKFEDRGAKNFDKLCTVKTNSDWTIVFYSPINYLTTTVYIQNYKLSASGLPLILYSVKWPVGSVISYTGATITEMKKHKGASFDTSSMPVLKESMSSAPENIFLGWKLSMGEVMQKLLDGMKKETVTGFGYNVTIQNGSVKNKCPYVSLWWNDGKSKNGKSLTVEPKTLQSYITKF